VPSQPIDVVKRSSRWAGQRWLLDAVIGLVGHYHAQLKAAANSPDRVLPGCAGLGHPSGQHRESFA
jgi:hypothetical protein